MRIVKTQSKQLDLAVRGALFAIINCAYVAVSVDFVRAAPVGYRFYKKA